MAENKHTAALDRRKALAVVAGALGAGTAVAGGTIAASHVGNRVVQNAPPEFPQTAASPNRTAISAETNPEMLALEALIQEAYEHFERCFDATTRAEEICIAWRKENPRPEMRECHVGTNAEYAIWWDAHQMAEDPQTVAHLDPNRDLKAAIAEHQERVRAWRALKDGLEQSSGLIAAQERQEAADDVVLDLCWELAEIPSRSLADLMCKARCVRYDADLTDVILRELLGMQSA